MKPRNAILAAFAALVAAQVATASMRQYVVQASGNTNAQVNGVGTQPTTNSVQQTTGCFRSITAVLPAAETSAVVEVVDALTPSLVYLQPTNITGNATLSTVSLLSDPDALTNSLSASQVCHGTWRIIVSGVNTNTTSATTNLAGFAVSGTNVLLDITDDNL
jgi:hypothetical protein